MRRWRAPTVWLIIAVLYCLMPLAYSTPPDPTYLAGIWDDADYDDVVVLVTSSIGSTDTHETSDLMRPLIAVALIVPGEEMLLSPASLSLHPPRAPPRLSRAIARQATVQVR